MCSVANLTLHSPYSLQKELICLSLGHLFGKLHWEDERWPNDKLIMLKLLQIKFSLYSVAITIMIDLMTLYSYVIKEVVSAKH